MKLVSEDCKLEKYHRLFLDFFVGRKQGTRIAAIAATGVINQVSDCYLFAPWTADEMKGVDI